MLSNCSIILFLFEIGSISHSRLSYNSCLSRIVGVMVVWGYLFNPISFPFRFAIFLVISMVVFYTSLLKGWTTVNGPCLWRWDQHLLQLESWYTSWMITKYNLLDSLFSPAWYIIFVDGKISFFRPMFPSFLDQIVILFIYQAKIVKLQLNFKNNVFIAEVSMWLKLLLWLNSILSLCIDFILLWDVMYHCLSLSC